MNIKNVMRRLVEGTVDRFVVPVAVVRPVASWRSRNVTARLVSCKVGHYTIQAYLVRVKNIRGRREVLQRALYSLFGFGDEDLFDCLWTQVGDQLHDMIVLQDVDFVIEFDERKKSRQERHDQTRCLQAYSEPLRRLAQLTGQHVTFDTRSSGVRIPSLEKEGIHLYTNAYPPGLNLGARVISTAFGLRIHDEGKEVHGQTPTAGRGVILKDTDDEVMVQVVGNSWYLLIPTMSHFNEDTSVEIFERLLALCYEASLARPVAAPTLSERSYRQKLQEWNDGNIDYVGEQIRSIDEQIASLERRLRIETQKKRQFVAIQDSWRGSLKPAKPGQAVREFKAITAHPLVTAVTARDGALFVHTAPIVIEHGGKRYAMGEYVLCFSEFADFGMWCVRPQHPKGRQHVHIGDSCSPCFGNAGSAISAALAEYRLADVVKYILDWLVHGYSPELAEVKIEEWPLVAEQPEAT